MWYMPFATEEIYQKFNEGSIVISSWPTKLNIEFNENDESKVNKLISIITSIRNMRVTNNVAPSKPLTIIIESNEEDKVFLLSVKDYLKRFANYEELIFDNNSNKEQSQVIVLDNLNVVIPLKELIDVAKEKLRLTAELTKLQSEVERSNKMLNNPSFVSKAPAQKVEDEKAKLAKFIQQLKEVETLLESLKQYE